MVHLSRTNIIDYLRSAAIILALLIPIPVERAIAPIPIVIPKPRLSIVTAYSSSPDETDSDPFITASGETVRKGVVACSREFPFETKFRINGETYECLDRLSPKYDKRFDIWMESKAEALEWGKQKLLVEMVD